jgi:hypothetical protein
VKRLGCSRPSIEVTISIETRGFIHTLLVTGILRPQGFDRGPLPWVAAGFVTGTNLLLRPLVRLINMTRRSNKSSDA